MRVYFVRHGQSEANVIKVFSNRGWKHPLTDLGRQQAQSLAEKLAGQGIIAIYTSPIRRAVESAEILASRLNVPHQIEPALAEFDVGIYEDRTDEEGWKHHADVMQRWTAGDFDARMTGGESCNDIVARLRPFLDRLIAQYSRQPGANIALIGHGGTYCNGLPRLIQNLPLDLALKNGLSNTGYAETVLRNGKLHCVRWGDATLE